MLSDILYLLNIMNSLKFYFRFKNFSTMPLITVGPAAQPDSIYFVTYGFAIVVIAATLYIFIFDAHKRKNTTEIKNTKLCCKPFLSRYRSKKNEECDYRITNNARNFFVGRIWLPLKMNL